MQGVGICMCKRVRHSVAARDPVRARARARVGLSASRSVSFCLGVFVCVCGATLRSHDVSIDVRVEALSPEELPFDCSWRWRPRFCISCLKSSLPRRLFCMCVVCRLGRVRGQVEGRGGGGVREGEYRWGCGQGSHPMKCIITYVKIASPEKAMSCLPQNDVFSSATFIWKPALARTLSLKLTLFTHVNRDMLNIKRSDVPNNIDSGNTRSPTRSLVRSLTHSFYGFLSHVIYPHMVLDVCTHRQE